MPHVTDYDWSRFDVHMLIACEPGEVYALWATSGGMERFYVKSLKYIKAEGNRRDPCDRAQAGDAYALEFDHRFKLEGQVTAADAATLRFAFTFGHMHVEVSCSPHSTGTLVTLTQTGISSDPKQLAQDHLNCRSCWVYYLLNLKSVLEHGVDLRDRGLPDNPVSINFGTQFAALTDAHTLRHR